MKVTVPQILQMAQRGERIAMVTAYDYPSARLVDAAGAPIILVGDSLGNVVLGYSSTIPVTMEDMIHHTAAVVRGTQHALVIADMPFMSYQASEEDGMRNAGRFLKETGCEGVKLEGGRRVAPLVQHLVDSGIPVMGHLGLTPQSVHQIGGYKVQGRERAQAKVLLEDALEIQAAGAFSIVLEYVAAPVAKLLSERLDIPTIGIGAGPDCDGQVLVFHDLLGLDPGFHPKHARVYANLGEIIGNAVSTYITDVQDGSFPEAAHSFKMSAEEESLLADL